MQRASSRSVFQAVRFFNGLLDGQRTATRVDRGEEVDGGFRSALFKSEGAGVMGGALVGSPRWTNRDAETWARSSVRRGRRRRWSVWSHTDHR